jgi:hypothetical protein
MPPPLAQTGPLRHTWWMDDAEVDVDDAEALAAWRTAVHEAGHAIAARLLNMSSGEARAWPEADAGAVFDADDGMLSACALMAGAAAEVLVCGDHHPHGFSADLGDTAQG